MVGKIASLASRPHLDAPPLRRQDDPTLPPRSLDASPPPRHHDHPPSPPSSIYTSDDLCPYRETFSCDIKALPAEFTSHPARLAIVSLLELEPDNTNQLWCRRACYTEENFEQWVEWSSPSKTHRDQRSCMRELDKETLLKAPDLLDADKKILEDAWVEYTAPICWTRFNRLCRWAATGRRSYRSSTSPSQTPTVATLVSSSISSRPSMTMC